MKKTFAAMAAFLFCFYSAGSQAQLGGPVQPNQGANAPSGPGLEETQAWIKDTYGKVYGDKQLIFFEGCTAIVLQKENYGVGKYDLANKFPMGDVVAKAGEFSQELVNQLKLESKFYVSIRAINDKTVFVHAYETFPRSCTGQCGSVADRLAQLKTHSKISPYPGLSRSMDFNSYLMAERIANAFNHAQKLCKKMELDAQSSKAAEDYNKNAKKPGDLF